MDLTALAPVILPALTGGIIASAVNTVVTLLVQFVPGVRVWFAGLSGDTKRSFFAVLTIVVGVAAFDGGSTWIGARAHGWSGVVGLALSARIE